MQGMPAAVGNFSRIFPFVEQDHGRPRHADCYHGGWPTPGAGAPTLCKKFVMAMAEGSLNLC